MPTQILAIITLVYGHRDKRLRAYTINWHYFVPGKSDAKRSLFAHSGHGPSQHPLSAKSGHRLHYGMFVYMEQARALSQAHFIEF